MKSPRRTPSDRVQVSVAEAPRISLSVIVALLLMVVLTLLQVSTAGADGVLEVTIAASYNLVVDSNAAATSTYAPSAATVMGRFCNTGDADLTNVQGYIGDFTAGTPGIYPSRDSAGFDPTHPLHGTGTYAFTHIGGQLGTADAARFMGTLAADECKVQYWHFTYPQCSNVGGLPDDPPCSGVPVWGDSVKPDDDLWLQFDIWGTSEESSGNANWTMTMRNEISALANKIEPNPDGRWFNTKTDIVAPGETITSNGVLYEFGNVRFGFDNDNDFVPDYNAWAQPVGDRAYDPSCFRLIRTSGVLTITRGSGNPDLLLPFDDQDPPHPNYGGPLYFSNLPSDNTGVTGSVYYTFLALNGPCTTALSPYQEVASGYDNEKFNGDYGTGVPPLRSTGPKVEMDKSSNPDLIPLGGTTTYQIPFTNTDDIDAGLGLSTGGSTPVVISDTVPSGTQYVGASATYSLTYVPNNGVTIRFSTDSGQTWSTTDPGPTLSTAPDSLVVIQWWLNDALPAHSSGNYAQFQITVPGTYTGSPFIENCADASYGAGAPFAEACAITLIQGNNSLGDRVWRDDDNDALQDGGEPGIANIAVSLYWDKNGDGLLDGDDPLIATKDSADGSVEPVGYYIFDQLPDGNYLVQVDKADTDKPTGHRITTRETYSVPLDPSGTDSNPVTYLDADFGFGPALSLDKQLATANPAYEGEEVIFTIDLTNHRPGDGSGQPQVCQYTTWSNSLEPAYTGTGNKAWINPDSIAGMPDGIYTTAPYANAGENVGVSGWSLGTYSGQPTSVEVLLPLQVNGTFGATESFEVVLWDCGPDGICDSGGGSDDVEIGRRAFYPLTDLSSGTLEVDFSADRSWTWSDFNGANIAVQLIATKQGNQTATLDVDAVAFRVSNGVICNDPNDIISPLPVSDTFDNTLLQFVSADPPESSVVGGTITWDDVGPLYPGATLRITVTFVALEPPDDDEPADGEADPTTHENCGTSTGATFIDGEPVNDAQDCETHDINPAGTIGDLVWSDVNSNGVYEPNGTDGDPNTADNEWGIPNVTVNLYDCGLDGVCDGGGGDDVFVATTTTDDTGWYLFESLRDGTYESVVVTTSLPDGGAGAVNTYDWDGDLDSDSGPVTINNNNGSSADDDFLDADFGYSLPALIIGSIWHDRDRSGSSTPDSGEEGLAGIVVYADDGACIPPTLPVPSGTCPYGITDANGDFVIGSADGPDGLPGTGDERLLTPDPTGTNYAVTVLQPSMPPGSWTQSYDTPNGPDGVPGTGDDVIQLDSLVQVTVVPGGLGRADYSYYQTGVTSLGDTLYVDWDGDGVEDPGEEGIPNVTVLLYEDDDGDGTIDPGVDAFMLTISTDATGFYHFDGLPADDYIVVVDEGDPDLPGNYNQTGDPDEDGVTCLVCDARGGADTVALDPDDTVDFGYQPVGAGSIGDFVWRDDDGDGIQDAGEPGIPDIDVDLYVWNDTNGDDVVDPGEQGPFVATASTGAGGEYLFTGLPAGKFLVNVDTTDPDLPVDGNSQPYVLSTNNDPHGVDLDVGEEYLDADFGFTAGGTIGDFVWQDNDTDGSQDLSEPGIPGVTVQLYNDVNGNGVYDPGTDTWVADDVTDGSGLYEFTGLPAGDYVVVVDTGTLPADFVQTGDPDETGACTTCDSESGTSIGDGDWIDWSRDFGYRPPGSIGDTVWIDTNGDGIKDDSETGIPYITVWLYDSDDVLVATTETDSGGIYGFGNVGDGSYYVRVDTSDSDFPSGLTLTYDPDEANPCTVCDSIGWTTISGGSSDLTRDFGYQFSGLNSISGTVYHDDDDDAIQDPVETTTYEDVTIYLWDCGADDSCGTGDDVFIGSTTTDANGDYIFSSLPDGLYVVAVNPDAPNLTGTDPTVTLSPTTSREVPLDHPLGTDPDPVNATDQDFGFLSRIDMGDLPASYGITSLSDDGARHIVPLEGAIYLGSAPPDTERNGQESANVDGDDNDGNDDEDGVAATPSVTWSAGPNGGSLDVTVGGCSGTCYFSAWIDWGNDDSLSQDGDRVLTAYPVSNGTQTIAFDIPAGATLDVEYYARYRLFASNSWLATSPTGMATNGEVEDYIHDLGPTAVSLVSLTATPAGSAILVEWETATEIDNLGFNLYRASSEDGPRVQLNGSLIPSQAPGSQAGAAYAYLDETSAPGINYYWLEAMDTRGVTTLHGPVSAVVHSSNLYHIYFPRIGK